MKEQEIRELLESIKVVPAEDDSRGNTCCKMKVSEYAKINQVLTLISQPKDQPTEFTKKVRMNLGNWDSLLSIQEDVRIKTIVGWLKKACEIIDISEARIKAMYAGDLSPESRLSGYKVVTDQLRQSLETSEASRKTFPAI